MAIITKKGPAGAMSGQIGGVVVTRWRGTDVGKSTPGKRRKKKDRQPLEQNLRLKLVTKFLSPFKQHIKIGFDKKTSKNPGFQTAVEYNLKHAVAGVYPDFEIDYRKAVFSQGALDMAWAAKIVLRGDHEILVTWEVPETSKIKVTGNDGCHVMLYSNKRHGLVDLGKLYVTRKDLQFSSVFSMNYYGETLQAWIFFSSPDNGAVSNTRYIGSIEIPEKEQVHAESQ
ncbi:DUF6266 family protein [Pedobacter hartonius]|uniref:Uncharacterized protein n=1 Tax=Pedobacter hartonius TaxID=425514 RepID=A0A1H4DTN0_9SPHI|nr:DUF6266 family protein [Pedobacter hartonius]SEA76114.1 hypothetical protein SAMN05443550_105102 [Pedobacter hartonius]